MAKNNKKKKKGATPLSEEQRAKNAEIYNRKGVFFIEQKRYDEAQQCFEKVLALNPNHTHAHSNIGQLFQEKQCFDKAQQHFEKTLSLDPGHADARWNLSLLQLILGDFSQGWKNYEARYHKNKKNWRVAPLNISIPHYQGENIRGKSLLICFEQGFGDAIQCVRFLPLLKTQKGVRDIILVCQAPLKKLFSSITCIDHLLDENEFRKAEIHGIDYWMFIMSLPLCFNVTSATLPNQLPYLSPSQAAQNKWKDRLPQGFKVGLVWKGSTIHASDKQRSLASIKLLKPLWKIAENINFISLQKDAGEEEAQNPPADQPLIHLGSDIQDFSDTAAIVSQLDLVICVDTAVAHLAGSLNIPCWVLLPNYHTDWRWMTDKEDSAWYPKVMKLFRQTANSNWDEVINKVSESLTELINNPTPPSQAIKHTAETTTPNEFNTHIIQLYKQGDIRGALQLSKQALKLFPDNVNLLENAGGFAGMLNEVELAKKYTLKSLAINPNNANTHNNLGLLYKEQKYLDKAQQHLEKALLLNPNHSEAHNNMGLLLQNQQYFDKAQQHFEKALKIEPNHINAHSELANLLTAKKQFSAAHAHYKIALELNPNDVDTKWNMSLLQLITGDFKQGWKNYEYRYHEGKKNKVIMKPNISLPQYQGEDLRGKNILIYFEQDSGDEIQFIRYLPLLKTQKGVRGIVLVCKPWLKKLFSSMDCIDYIFDENEVRETGVQKPSYWVFMMSLPLHFNTTLKTIPNQLPYLSSPKTEQEKWRDKLPQGFNIGLVWKNEPMRGSDASRSLPSIKSLKPLWQVAENVNFISLQKGVGEEEAQNPPTDQPLTHLGNEVQDFADSAAIISQLDLVVCVDTAIAHLAGSLNIPCWILLSDYNSDWRWMTDKENSIWYPEVTRLFRQATNGDWDEVVAKISVALTQKISE